MLALIKRLHAACEDILSTFKCLGPKSDRTNPCYAMMTNHIFHFSSSSLAQAKSRLVSKNGWVIIQRTLHTLKNNKRRDWNMLGGASKVKKSLYLSLWLTPLKKLLYFLLPQHLIKVVASPKRTYGTSIVNLFGAKSNNGRKEVERETHTYNTELYIKHPSQKFLGASERERGNLHEEYLLCL